MPSKLTVDTPDDLKIVITRAFDAPRDLVFNCITTPDLVKRWMTGPPGWTMPVCEIDLKVGGTYRYVWRSDDGKKPEFGVTGVFREIEAPNRLVHTEKFVDCPQPSVAWPPAEVVATTVFTEHDGKTTMTLTMHYPSAEIREQALKSGM